MEKLGPCPVSLRSRGLKEIELTPDLKNWIGDAVAQKVHTSSKLATLFGHSARTFRDWAEKRRQGLNIDKHVGRRPILEEEDLIELATSCDAGVVKKRSVDYSDKVLELAEERASKRGKSSHNIHVPGKKTMRKYEERVGINTGQAEVISDAKENALASMRNLAAFAAMNTLMTNRTIPELTLNYDSTVFTVGYDMNKKVEVKYVGKRPESLKTSFKKEDKGDTLFSIKYFLVVCAAGYCASPIYIIADECMNETDIDVHDVRGMGNSNSIDNNGFVVFCKTRSCNANFYIWLNTDIIIPFVNKIRADDENWTDKLGWLQVDGEDTQLKCYADHTIQQILELHKIAVGKPPGSTTSITQPCDVKSLFKGTKQNLKQIKDKDISQNATLIKRLKDMLLQHFTKMSIDSKSMKPAKKQMVVYGLLRVQLALILTVKRTTIQESFQKAGIYPLDIDQMWRQFDIANVTEAERLNFAEKLPQLVTCMGRHGELMENDFAAAHIREDSDAGKGKVRDQRNVTNRRSCILTCRTFIKRELERQETTAEAKRVKDERLATNRANRAKKKEAKEALAAQPPAEEIKGNNCLIS